MAIGLSELTSATRWKAVSGTLPVCQLAILLGQGACRSRGLWLAHEVQVDPC